MAQSVSLNLKGLYDASAVPNSNIGTTVVTRLGDCRHGLLMRASSLSDEITFSVAQHFSLVLKLYVLLLQMAGSS